MRYVSTRGEAPQHNFVDVMLAGLARDGGLYVPVSWPTLDPKVIAGFAGRPYAEVAVEVIKPFVGDSIPEADLARMAREAYGTFRHPATAPLVQLSDSLFVLELFHGPTLAFKDLAMQLVARLMDHVLIKRSERTTIVVATSGDTGGEAVEAFRGRSQVDVVVLYPHGRISEVQRRMMTTTGDPNVHTLAIEGTFDDCQALVKSMFNHHAFRDRVRLSGVNSINWARIVAQVVYYFTAAVALGSPHRKVAFTVPTGNFGDVYAGYVASRMGLPVDRLVVATNVNDILARTLATDPDPKNRDGAQAVTLAENANIISGGNQPFVLDILAMAYAEAGRFPDAQQIATKAIDLATNANLPDLATAIRQHLALYQANQPCRDAFTNAPSAKSP